MNPDTGRTAASTVDPFSQFKAAQRAGWAHFGPLAVFTTQSAARLVRFARVKAAQRVLDVGSGTGVVAVTAARLGAEVTGSDLTPELLEQARENARIADVQVEWREADVESLPFGDAEFDVVTSQFGHMFAPRPDVAVAEMLRVLKSGGTIAFSTWPPDQFVGKSFALTARYAPPPPPGVAPPVEWGEPAVIRERLGAAVRDLTFERDLMTVNTLSPQHVRFFVERTAGPMLRLVEALEKSDPARLAAFRSEYDALTEEYVEMNTLRQSYLMTRALKV
jgi:SAM-dependent methyltransferase